jgi:hypothetical protein
VSRRSWLLIGALPLAGCGRFGFAVSDEIEDIQPGDARPGDASTADAGTTPDASLGALNRVFVTAATYAGNFGSSAAADAICQTAADDADLGGTFVALLADATRGLTDALAGSRGWVDLGGLPIADLPSDWLDGNLRYPVRRTEAGTLATGYTWLGTDTRNCDGWTTTGGDGGAYGQVAATTSPRPTTSCNNLAHVVCVELGRSAPLPTVSESGRNVFVSEYGWQSGAGLASADAYCAAEAAGAGLPGSYLAALATSTGGPMARFDPEGAPWRRVDGVRLAPTAAEFAAQPVGQVYATFVNRVASGEVQSIYGVMIGSVADNCADWTSANAAEYVPAGWTYSAEVSEFWASNAWACGASGRLLCVQE